MDERWTVVAPAFIPGSEISFPEALPGSPLPEPTKWTRAFDLRWRERKKEQKQESVSIIGPAHHRGCSCLSEEISWGYTGITRLTAHQDEGGTWSKMGKGSWGR